MSIVLSVVLSVQRDFARYSFLIVHFSSWQGRQCVLKKGNLPDETYRLKADNSLRRWAE